VHILAAGTRHNNRRYDEKNEDRSSI